MDELQALCARLAGPGEAARQVAARARALDGERTAQLAAAVRGCQELAARVPPPSDPPGEGSDLRGAVTAELARACAGLSPEQRAALALRELLALDHDAVAVVLGLAPAAVAPLLAGARIALRATLRGARVPPGDCIEHERTLRTVTRRQDGEPVRIEDEDWLYEHLGHCQDCVRSHSAMLEGSSCYQGWGS